MGVYFHTCGLRAFHGTQSKRFNCISMTPFDTWHIPVGLEPLATSELEWLPDTLSGTREM